ncbi:MAG: helix-turn-helix domain-containing protein [Oscillospiraceae bacterium]|jgi:transcriptional regulator with XRE-family HTH domain|nr:helix-turn-helix domain-containing protein [Oscillospiraceae bacterium]
MSIHISDNLKRLRRSLDLTQEELANKLGVSAQAISKWERGDNFPDITLLPAIATFCEVSTEELLGMGVIRSEKRIEDAKKWTREYKQQQSFTGYEPVAKLWEELSREFPHNWEVQYEYALALDLTQLGKTVEEQEQIRRSLIPIFRHILENSADSELRKKVTGDLISTLQSVFEFDEARELLDQTSLVDPWRLQHEIDHALLVTKKYCVDHDFTTPELLKQIDPDKARELLEPFRAATAQFAMFTQTPFWDYIHWAYDFGFINGDEFAELSTRLIPLQELAQLGTPNQKPQWAYVYSRLVQVHIKAGKIEKALDYFEAQIEALLATDRSEIISTRRYNTNEDGSTTIENVEKPLRETEIERLETDPGLAPIRNEPRYKAAIAKLIT